MIVEQQLQAVMRAGHFRDPQHVVEEALEALLAERPQLRTETAIELYRSGQISLLRGAEIACLDFESFRLLLRDRGIPWEIEADASNQMDADIEAFFTRQPR
jgi:predicted HTH domain antitoxin